ncbi:MAG: Bax inhibitor-1/YccA family protein [Pseudomonadota bacterium]
MNDFNRSMAAHARSGTMDTSVDAGLRGFMLGVYNKLALGIALSGLIAFAVGTVQPLTYLVFGTPLSFVVQFGPIALIFGSMFLMRNPSPTGTGILYWSIVTLIGAGLGMWVAMATSGMSVETRGGAVLSTSMLTIAKAFLVTASAFGALSLFGYQTKMNLRPLGVFMIMALWGVVILSLVSFLFPPSGMLELGIQLAVLALSAGMVAWQTQELKENYYQIAGDTRSMAVMTNYGALNFFIMFVNMFQVILSLMSRE